MRDAATAQPNEEAVLASNPSILDQACARCRGHCCRNGGEEAYLTEDTIRRYLHEHPGTRPLDLLEAYLARVGHETFEGSCIFHGPTGCTLSREMRSDTCNGYFCGTDGIPARTRLTPDARILRNSGASRRDCGRGICG